MVVLEKHLIPNNISSVRFIDYALLVFTDIPTKSAMKKAIKRNRFFIDDIPIQTGTYIEAGQTITRVDTEKTIEKFYRIKLDIIYEDEHFAIVNKPSGIIVSGNSFKTIVNALPLHLKKSNEKDTLKVFKPIHRLDGPTSGLLIVAKTAKSLALLGQMLERKEIQKEYIAIVCGKTNEEGIINTTIDGQEACTSYASIKSVPSLQNEFLTLIRLKPHTGRTHQLRIHMSTIDKPIMGDTLYGSQKQMLKGKGLFLCAHRLLFSHPITNKEINISTTLPEKYESLLTREQKRWEKFKS